VERGEGHQKRNRKKDVIYEGRVTRKKKNGFNFKNGGYQKVPFGGAG